MHTRPQAKTRAYGDRARHRVVAPLPPARARGASDRQSALRLLHGTENRGARPGGGHGDTRARAQATGRSTMLGLPPARPASSRAPLISRRQSAAAAAPAHASHATDGHSLAVSLGLGPGLDHRTSRARGGKAAGRSGVQLRW